MIQAKMRFICTSVFLSIVFLFVPLTTGTAQSSKSDMRSVVKGLHELYVDVYPRIKKMRLYRKQGNSSKANNILSSLRSEVPSRLRELKQGAGRIRPSRNDLSDRAEGLRKLVALFEEWQRKILTDWTPPDNPKVYKAFNRRELMRKGIAKPPTLRKRMIQGLMGYMNDDVIFSESPLDKNLKEYEKQVKSMFWRVSEKFLSLLNRIDEARKEENEVASAQESASKEWNSFWEDLEDQRQELETGINRILLMFRDRNVSSAEQAQKKRLAIKLKKSFQKVMNFRRTGEVFSDPDKLRVMLVQMGKKYLNRLWPNVRKLKNELVPFYNEFSSMISNYKNTQGNKQYQKHVREMDKAIDKTYELFQVKEARNAIQEIPVDKMDSISTRLTADYGKEELKLGTALKRLSVFTNDYMKLSGEVYEFPRNFKRVYNELSFDASDRFQKKLSEKISEKQKQMEDQMNQMNKKFRQVKTLVEKAQNMDYSLEKVTEEENQGG